MSSGIDAIVEFKEVSFSYGRQKFMEGLNLRVKEADFIGLLGANGSGKSTILKLMAGILKPAMGAVRLWDKPIDSYRNKDRAKLISYLPQMLDITVPFRLRELVGMGLYPYDSQPPMNIADALGMVGLKDRAGSLVINLSGGERRRAFIAMTLIQGAGVLLLDEPLANLDIKYQLELIRLLKELNEKRNITVVMALHDINLALGFGSLLLIKEGRVLGIGRPEEVLNDALLKEAFETDITIKRNGTHAYISYMEE